MPVFVVLVSFVYFVDRALMNRSVTIHEITLSCTNAVLICLAKGADPGR
jgi:hypothetical protein